MGMYTELLLKCIIKKDAPENVKQVVKFLFSKEEQPDVLPEHEFFQCDRWQCIGSCSSYYHYPEAISSINVEFDELYIFSRSDLKNYDSEIEKFIDWLNPYVDTYEGMCIGWKWYEEDDQPTLIYKQ